MQEKTTLLLVGENPSSFPDLGEIADHIGLDFFEAGTTALALEACQQEGVALIVVSADSPNIDPVTLIDMLRNDSEARQIPVLFAGGDASGMGPRSADEGPIDFVTCMVGDHLLISRIRMMVEWFNQRRRIEWLEAEHERLDTLNRQIRKFVGNVAHDLRGPLAKLINTSEVLLSGVDPEALHSFYEVLVQTSRRGFNLVNDIMDITALESGQLQLSIEKCDLAEIASSVHQELEYLATAKEQTLANEIHETLLVSGDRRRLIQIVVNLVNNAIKFTPRGGVIRITAETRADGVHLSVSDSGVGIPYEKQLGLFQKHLKNSTPGTEGEQGTGFGLPLAQELALAHHTSINVTSEIGHGTKFSLLLPSWKSA